MPTYDYRCTVCGHEIEVTHGVHGQGPDACPVCGGTMRKAFVVPAIHFKGSGWAKKDRGASNSTKAARAGSGDGSSAKGGDDAGRQQGDQGGSTSGDGDRGGSTESRDGNLKRPADGQAKDAGQTGSKTQDPGAAGTSSSSSGSAGGGS